MDNPEPTEAERDLETTKRLQEEEDMRGNDQDDDNLPTEDE